MSKPDPSEQAPHSEKPAPVIDVTEMAAAMAAKMEAASAKADDDMNAADVATVSSKPLTYFNTKTGPFYVKAKQILQTGNFESTLSKIETGITTILSLLPSPDELHESLGPFYYMYGTTLLYSVEESQDTADTNVMAQQGGEDGAEDLQIAWENLESARNILAKLSYEGAEEEERVLDLAQLHVRLADLSRHNGHYQQAITDYEACNESRRSLLKGDKLWDRRIADVEYSLGMTSLLLAAEGEKNLQNEENGEKDEKDEGQNALLAAMTSAASGDTENTKKVNLSPEEIQAFREKSLRHYVQCARILAGVIATKAGADPSIMADADEILENNENKKCASKETSTINGDSKTVQEHASTALSTIRDRVSGLKPTDDANINSIHDLREMLDEIQETIDNCEQDRVGLRDVNEMRKKAEDDIKKADTADAFAASNKDKSSNGTTTIGFGGSSASAASSAAATTTIGFGAGSAGQAEKVAAAPMMVTKKKKKKVTLENSSSKRAKTE